MDQTGVCTGLTFCNNKIDRFMHLNSLCPDSVRGTRQEQHEPSPKASQIDTKRPIPAAGMDLIPSPASGHFIRRDYVRSTRYCPEHGVVAPMCCDYLAASRLHERDELTWGCSSFASFASPSPYSSSGLSSSTCLICASHEGFTRPILLRDRNFDLASAHLITISYFVSILIKFISLQDKRSGYPTELFHINSALTHNDLRRFERRLLLSKSNRTCR